MFSLELRGKWQWQHLIRAFWKCENQDTFLFLTRTFHFCPNICIQTRDPVPLSTVLFRQISRGKLFGSSHLFSESSKPVLQIYDILGWIRIRILGSMPLTNGSGFGSWFGSGSWIRILLFSTLTFKTPSKNLFFSTIFSAYYFLKLNLHHFSKIKSQKE